MAAAQAQIELRVGERKLEHALAVPFGRDPVALGELARQRDHARVVVDAGQPAGGKHERCRKAHADAGAASGVQYRLAGHWRGKIDSKRCPRPENLWHQMVLIGFCRADRSVGLGRRHIRSPTRLMTRI